MGRLVVAYFPVVITTPEDTGVWRILVATKQADTKGTFVILVQSKSDVEDLSPLREIYRTFFGEDDVFAQAERYYMVCVLMQPKEGTSYAPIPAMAQVFVKSHKINEPLPSLFSFAFFDPEGKLNHSITPQYQQHKGKS